MSTISSRYKYLLSISALCAVLLAAYAASGLAADRPTGVQVGSMAPDFSVQRMDGKTFHLADFRGKKPVYLVFWATWCPTCLREIPDFKALHQRYGKDVEMLAINVDTLSWASNLTSTKRRVEHYRKKHQLPYNIALDDDNRLAELFAVRGTPTQMLIDKNGFIRNRFAVLTNNAVAVLEQTLRE